MASLGRRLAMLERAGRPFLSRTFWAAPDNPAFFVQVLETDGVSFRHYFDRQRYWTPAELAAMVRSGTVVKFMATADWEQVKRELQEWTRTKVSNEARG